MYISIYLLDFFICYVFIGGILSYGLIKTLVLGNKMRSMCYRVRWGIVRLYMYKVEWDLYGYC